jgi:hypothetical protein
MKITHLRQEASDLKVSAKDIHSEIAKLIPKPRIMSRTSHGDGTQQCANCLEIGHWSYECIKPKVYAPKQSRTDALKKGIVVPESKGVFPDSIPIYTGNHIDTNRHTKLLEERIRLEAELEDLQKVKKRKPSSDSSSESSSDSSSESSLDSEDTDPKQ